MMSSPQVRSTTIIQGVVGRGVKKNNEKYTALYEYISEVDIVIILVILFR